MPATTDRTSPTRTARWLAATTGAVVAAALAATSVLAAPVERTRSTIECDGVSVSVVMHPGWAGSVLWDVSGDEQDKPSFIMKQIDGETFVDGVSQGTFSTSLGEMTGFGEPLSCTWEVHKPGFDAYGTSLLVQL